MKSNTERNYAVRLMLLASADNPYKHGDISVQEFDSLINAYHNLDSHTERRLILQSQAESMIAHYSCRHES